MTATVTLRLMTVASAVALLLTGCSGARVEAPVSAATSPRAGAAAGSSVPEPSDGIAPLTARMVCGGEVARNLKELDGLPRAIPATSTWKDQIFTCTYTLAEGPLVLTVKKSATNAEAKSYFSATQAAVSGVTMPSFAALGIPAYSTPQGAVSFVKDDMTLLVDVTALPDSVGPQATKRGEFASTVASFVLACWREHG